MAKMLSSSFLLLCTLLGCYAAVDISPLNPLVKSGDEVLLMCRSGSPLSAQEDCAWTQNGGSIRLKAGSAHERHGNFERGECGVKFTATEANQGRWVCTVFENDVSSTRDTNVTLSALPTVTLDPSGNTLEVQADEETEITCRAENGRPEPEIRWMIGDMVVQGSEAEVIDRTSNGLVSLQSKLRYRFAPEDHKKPIRCTAVIQSGNREYTEPAVATLEVLFPPKAEEQVSIQYGFIVGQPGSVVVNISANPAPSDLTWYIGDVEVNGMGGASADRHFTARMVSSEDVLHRAILNISQLTPVDATQTYVLKAKSTISGTTYTTEYRMKLSSEAEPVRDAASVGGGTLGGIIIAVVVILVILFMILIARAKGLLCFKPVPAPDSKPSEREPSETESAGQNPLDGEDKSVDSAMKSESKYSLGSRLRNMYGSIKARTGKNKGEKMESDVEAPKPMPEKRSDSVIYAELDLREVTRAPVVKDPLNLNTEYAEIIGILPQAEQQEETKKTEEQKE